MTSSRPESVFGTHRTNDSPWDDSVIPGGAFFYPGIPPRSGAAGAAGEASSSQTAYPSPRRRRQDTILPGSPWDKPSPHAKKARGTGPRALVSSASISTCRPCRERREQREREARACRPPGSRWSAAHRPRRRHSPERNGSPWWGPRCRRRSCRSRSRSGR